MAKDDNAPIVLNEEETELIKLWRNVCANVEDRADKEYNEIYRSDSVLAVLVAQLGEVQRISGMFSILTSKLSEDFRIAIKSGPHYLYCLRKHFNVKNPFAPNSINGNEGKDEAKS